MNTQRGRRYFAVAVVGITLFIAAACQPGDLAPLQGVPQNVDSLSDEVTVKLKDRGGRSRLTSKTSTWRRFARRRETSPWSRVAKLR